VSERERYERGKGLFLEAVRLVGDAREEFLARECGDDRELRAVVDSLLANDAGTGEGWTGVPLRAAALDGSEELRPPTPPAEIDGYRILGLLGAGGMGTVYEAEQPSPRRVVALKVLRPEIVSAASLRRFAHETEVLGRLEHPGIARIYGAGRTASGTPYFVMERIHGAPLLEHVRQRRLDRRERLALHAKICDAVHHAHCQGVIHRDLKPSNILVEPDGRPRVLDFGIAAHADEGARSRSLATGDGQLVGTVPYMSPEQTFGSGASVDTRSDVYALGVLLHELMAGRLPYPISDSSVFDMLRAIRERAPEPLGACDRSYRGDIETIAAKALEKDPSRRYGSAAELAADIRRSLANEPITATPPSAGYRLSKFARRHRLLVATLLLIALTLIAASAVSSYWAIAARRESARSRLISEFLGRDWIESIDPELGRRDLSMLEMLDRASVGVGERFAGEPLVEASVRRTIGRTYERLGEYVLAAPHLERAHALYLRERGSGAVETADAAADLAMLRASEGRLAECEEILRAVLPATLRQSGENSRRTAMVLNKLGVAAMQAGRHEESIGLFRRARAAEAGHRERTGEGIGTLALIIAGDLAHALTLAGRVDEADDEFRAAFAAGEPLFAELPLREAHLAEGLAEVRLEQDRLGDAEELLLRALGIRERVQGERHPMTAETRRELAGLRVREGRFEEAERLVLRALDDLRAAHGPAHPQVFVARNDLGSILQRAGRLAEAESVLGPALAEERGRLGEDHPTTVRAKQTLGSVLGGLGRAEEGLGLLREAMESQVRAAGAEHPDSLTMSLNVGVALNRLSRFAEAEEVLEPVVAVRVRTEGEARSGTIAAIDALAQAKFGLGKSDEAEAMLERALAARRANGEEESPESVRMANNLGFHYLRAGRFSEAEAHLGAALAGQRRIAPSHPNIVFMAINLGRALHALGRYDDAIATFQEGIERLAAITSETDGRKLTLIEGIALAHRAAGRFEEAELGLLEVHAECVRLFGEGHRNSRQAAGRLAELYEGWGRPDEATIWRSRAALD